MCALHAVESQQFGLAKESVRGTAEAAPLKWYQTRGMAELDYALQHLPDTGIRGIKAEFPAIAGVKVGGGKIPLFFDPQQLGEFFYALLGGVASAEDATITISAANNKLNFNIGASELTATIASTTYVIGTTSATASTLCAAIKDALFAADATGTYTVTYSRTTKLFTIARSAGTLNLLASTGTNVANGIWATIGFAATDRTGSITYAGTVQVEYAFTHTVTQSTTNTPQSYTFFQDRGLNVMKYNLGVVKSLSLKSSVDGLVETEAEVLFKSEATGSIGSPAFPTQRYISFQHIDFKIATVSNTDIKEWELKVDNSARGHRTQGLTQDVQDIIAVEKLSIEGSFTIYFTTATERDKFMANTATAINIVAAGATIAGSSKWAANINLYDCRYQAFPYTEDSGLLAAKVKFKGHYSTSDSKAIQVAVTNQDVSY